MLDEVVKKRVHLIDELRGFAIVCMVIYHLFYDLVKIFNVNIPFFYSPFIQTLVPIFVFIFVFISGTASAYSRSNLLRGLKCFGLGMAMTIFTYFFMSDQLIIFGILHMLGVSMMLFSVVDPLLKKINPSVLINIAILLFILTYNVTNGYIGWGELRLLRLPRAPYELKFLFPLGFISSEFYSADYFALLPWFFAFIAGSAFGKLLIKGNMPEFLYKSHFIPLAFIGRHTLIVYLLHQPLIYGILSLIFIGQRP